MLYIKNIMKNAKHFSLIHYYIPEFCIFGFCFCNFAVIFPSYIICQRLLKIYQFVYITEIVNNLLIIYEKLIKFVNNI